MKVTNVGISEEGLRILSEFVDKLNKDSKRAIGRYLVLEYAVQKLTDSDIPKLQGKYYRPSDKFKVILEEFNREHSDTPLDEEQLMASMIEAFQSKNKHPKLFKTDPKQN